MYEGSDPSETKYNRGEFIEIEIKHEKENGQKRGDEQSYKFDDEKIRKKIEKKVAAQDDNVTEWERKNKAKKEGNGEGEGNKNNGDIIKRSLRAIKKSFGLKEEEKFSPQKIIDQIHMIL